VGGGGVTLASSSSLNPELLQALRALPSLSVLLLQGAVLAAADAQQLPAGVTRCVEDCGVLWVVVVCASVRGWGGGGRPNREHLQSCASTKTHS
jgi:hypothetical protein